MGLAILYILAALWFTGNQLLAYRRARKSDSWPKVTGVIEHAQRQIFALDDYGNLTGVRIIYRYRVKNETYTARTVGFSPKFIASRKMLYTHKPGKKVVIYYSPDDPSIATLEKGVTTANYVMIVASFLLVGFTVINLFLQLGFL